MIEKYNRKIYFYNIDDMNIINMDYIKKTGIEKGYIQVNTNIENPIFRGFRTHLLGELNTFIDQLNNIFKVDDNGMFRIRTDTTGLIDNAHYNKELIKDGKLTGKFFKFEKLFEKVLTMKKK